MGQFPINKIMIKCKVTMKSRCITEIWFTKHYRRHDPDIQAPCTIASKINVSPKGALLPISKVHSNFAVAYLLTPNNISQICHCVQIPLQSAALNCSFSDNLDISGGNIYFAGDGTIALLPSGNSQTCRLRSRLYSEDPCPNYF